MDSPFDQSQRFAKLWMDYAAKIAQTGVALDPVNTPPDVARQMRAMTFQAMAHYAEEFMRSPQFLETMKQSLETAIAGRKQVNDFLTAVQHNVQGVARQDIDSLMLGMRHIETRLLEAMTDVGNRLDAISRRLDALNGQPPPNGDPARQTTVQATDPGQADIADSPSGSMP